MASKSLFPSGLMSKPWDDTKTTNTPTFFNDTDAYLTMKRQELLDANDQLAITFIPVMVFFGFLSITGAIGNSLVCFVFIKKIRQGSQNFLIICLAVFDLLPCTFGIPYEILDLRYNIYYIFESFMLCKMSKFLITVSFMSSVATLLLLAIDRYRKICQPLKKQFKLKHIQIVLVILVVASVLLSLPQCFIFGSRTVASIFIEGNSTVCLTPDELLNTIYPAAYKGFLSFLQVVSAVVLIVLYVKIWRESKQWNKRKILGPMNKKSNSPSSAPRCRECQDLTGDETSTTFLSCDQNMLRTSNEEENQFGKTNKDVTQIAEVTKCDFQSYRKSSGTVTLAKSDDKNVTEDHSEEDQGDFFRNSTSTILKEEDTNVTKTQGDKDSLDGTQTNPPLITASTTSPKKSTKDNTTAISSLSDEEIKLSFPQATTEVSPMPERKLSCTSCINAEDSPSNKKQKWETSNKQRRTRNRITLVAFLVTFVYIFSFLPHMSLVLASHVIAPGFEEKLTGTSLATYNLFLHSYFINCASNPFIYGVLHASFRREVKKIFARFIFWKQ